MVGQKWASKIDIILLSTRFSIWKKSMIIRVRFIWTKSWTSTIYFRSIILTKISRNCFINQGTSFTFFMKLVTSDTRMKKKTFTNIKVSSITR